MVKINATDVNNNVYNHNLIITLTITATLATKS